MFDQEDLLNLLRDRQRAFVLWPSHLIAREEFHRMADQLPRASDTYIVPHQLSFVRDNPEARQSVGQTFVKFLSFDTDPDIARAAQAIIVVAKHPRGGTAHFLNYHRWMDLQPVCEAYRV